MEYIAVALMVAAFYFLVIMPTKRRQERAIEIEDHIRPGVEIVTTAGLYGRIVSTDEISIRLEVSPGVVLRFSKMAILRVVTPESEAKEAAKAAKIAAERERVKNKGRKPPKPKATPPAASPPTAPPPAHPANGEEPGPKTL